jgi:orotate phosphoribosyltransferase
MGSAELDHDELGRGLRDAAYLEGDFLLRSGRRSKYYLDKYRFETRPDLLAPLGAAIAAAVSEHEPEAVRIAGPELGAVALAASASLASGLPFLIVRKAAKDYGTANQLEGVFAAGECVCLVEDVVTSGGAAVEAVEALRSAGLRVSNAVCVVDREEGGVDELARYAVRLRPLFTVSELLKTPANPHG